MRRTTVVLLIMALWGSFIPTVQSEQTADLHKAFATGESDNWKVSVVTAASYTEPRRGPHDLLDPPVSPNNFNLLLELRFEYIGSAGEVSAPTVGVMNAREERFNAIGDIQMAVSNASDIEALNWLMSATHPKPDKRPLKGGEKFGPVTYYVAGIPQGSTNLKLLFADVTPITLRLTELK